MRNSKVRALLKNYAYDKRSQLKLIRDSISRSKLKLFLRNLLLCHLLMHLYSLAIDFI